MSKLLYSCDIRPCEYKPQPINGINTATGDAVESIIQASLARLIFNPSTIGRNKGPTIKGVPESVKKSKAPLVQAAVWAFILSVINLVIIPAKAAAPPDFSIRPTRPATKIINNKIPTFALFEA